MKAEEDLLMKEYEKYVVITLEKMIPDTKNFADSLHLGVDDLLQYGRLGLWKAIKTRDKMISNNFRSHVIRNIKWSLGRNISIQSMKESIYKDKYYKRNKLEHRKVDVVSMSNKPFGEHEIEETTYYDIVGYDNINKFENDSIDNQAIDNIECIKIFSLLKDHEKRMVLMKLKGYKETEIAKCFGISRQAINTKFKNMQKRLNELGVVPY
jgi:RNA polymerase sigma factor (sigma-70 family)